MLKYANYGVVFQEIPGETTLSINISSCPIHCKGCHSTYLWDDIGEKLDEESLEVILSKYEDEITCVCFMGGDRYPAIVNSLAVYVRMSRPWLKIGWYSGKDELSSLVHSANFDYIKLGPYDEKLGGLKSPGTNQRLYRIDNGSWIDYTSKFWKHGKL